MWWFVVLSLLHNRSHLGAGAPAGQKRNPVRSLLRSGPTLCVRPHGNLVFETRNGGKHPVRSLRIHGDCAVDHVGHGQQHRRRSQCRDRVGPGRGERGNDPAGLPPLVPGRFGLRMLFAVLRSHRPRRESM